jgi:hypothetical protein
MLNAEQAKGFVDFLPALTLGRRFLPFAFQILLSLKSFMGILSIFQVLQGMEDFFPYLLEMPCAQ